MVNSYVVLGLAALLVAASLPLQGSASSTPTPIQHLVLILQENHSFDNYFGTFPGAKGIPAGTCVPNSLSNPLAGCTAPYWTTNVSPTDISHGAMASNCDVNKGSMNGFVQCEKSTETMSYYNGTTLPNYWSYARNYALLDNFFSETPGWSLPNHWELVASAYPPSVANAPPYSFWSTYTSQANPLTTLLDRMITKGVSFTYYDTALTFNYSQASQQKGGIVFWNPFIAQNRTYYAPYSSHFKNRIAIFGDIAKGRLPAVSFVMPNANVSEHPSTSTPQLTFTANLTLGMEWTTSIVNAIERSPYWASTMIVISWDDFGGFYDHVVPPKDQAGYQLGIRVPAMVISPYTPVGEINHTLFSFSSILRFIEINWGIQSINSRDARANSIGLTQNWAQQPRAPFSIDSPSVTELASGGVGED
jgi:phospholipase C